MHGVGILGPRFFDRESFPRCAVARLSNRSARYAVYRVLQLGNALLAIERTDALSHQLGRVEFDAIHRLAVNPAPQFLKFLLIEVDADFGAP